LFGLRLILYLTIPAAVALVVLGRPLVGLLLERGAFDAGAADATAFALALFAIGLPGHAVIEIVDRVFYAERDTRTPVMVAAGAVALNIGLSVVLMTRTELSFGGLALANSVAALTEATVLVVLLRRRMGWLPARELVGFGWRVALAAATMGALAALVLEVLSPVVSTARWSGQVALVASAGAFGIVGYVGVSLVLGIDDARRAAALLLHRS
jgi:putative peptidoglycan lipid II flippase